MFTRVIFNMSQLLKKCGVDFHENQNPAVLAMKQKIDELKGINFKIEQYPDGNWTAESTNIDGIITGGNDIKESNKIIKDAIFTYFEIPPQMVNNNLVKTGDEPVTIEKRVYAMR